MLTNKFYIGIFMYAGEYHEASHKCFVSKKLFEAVQKHLTETESPRKRKHYFPFIGMARCGSAVAELQLNHTRSITKEQTELLLTITIVVPKSWESATKKEFLDRMNLKSN